MEKVFCALRKIKSTITVLLLRLEYGTRIDIGKNFSCRSNISMRIKKTGLVRIGDNVFFNNYCSINCMERIEIGNDCIFGEGVKIYDHNHQYREKNKPIHEQGYKIRPINIGSNCWIGSNVIILAGVSIGNHCVIGAGTIIYKDIPDNSIVKNCKKQDVVNIEVIN